MAALDRFHCIAHEAPINPLFTDIAVCRLH